MSEVAQHTACHVHNIQSAHTKKMKLTFNKAADRELQMPIAA